MFKKKSKSSLIYFMSETHFFSQDYSVLVVNFVGSIDQQTLPIIHECRDEILKSKSKWIILNFRDISHQSDHLMIGTLDELKKMIQQNSVVLRLSGLHPTLRSLLVQEKIVDEESLFNNLADALRITTGITKQAA
jgi:anti-anti-sigma regulatory factor